MKKTFGEKIFNLVSLIVTTLFALACILPILLTISGSFTEERALFRGIKLIPEKFSLEAYATILENPAEMLNAYKITILLVIVGTVLSLLITSFTAYALYRPDLKGRNIVTFYLFFTTLFSGGLVPSYILMCNLELRNTFWVLVISGVFSVFNVIIMRTYLSGNVPQSLVESAKIDGANDFVIYYKIVMPTAKPIIATVGLITALGYWNSWSPAMLYIDEKKLYPLQYYLYKIFSNAEMSQVLQDAGQKTTNVPTEGFKLAMTVFTMGPVVLFYPFVQKYFVSGVTVGAVKG